jgi:hypothetical protein
MGPLREKDGTDNKARLKKVVIIVGVVLFAALLIGVAVGAERHIEIAPTETQTGLSPTFTFELSDVSVMGAPVRFQHRITDADVAGEMELQINGNVIPSPLGEGSLSAGARIPGRTDNGEDWIAINVDRAFFNYAGGTNTIRYRPLRSGSSYSVTGIVIDYTLPEMVEIPETPPAPIVLPVPTNFTKLAEAVQGTAWQLPECWQSAIAQGDWRTKIRTYSTPDRWYAGFWCRDNGHRYEFSGSWPEVQNYMAQRRGVDPSAPPIPFDACDKAFLWSDDEPLIVNRCSYAYTSSTTATTVPVYQSITSTTRVGTLPKGASCAAFEMVQPAASANQYWFKVKAADTGAEGFARCRNTGY